MEDSDVEDSSEDTHHPSANETRTRHELTWVHYTDPQKERKRKENRSVVRKAAKLSSLSSSISQKALAQPLPLRQSGNQATKKVSEVPNGSSEDFVPLDENRKPSSLQNPTIQARWGNSDPFDSLAARTNNQSFSFLNRYCESIHFRPSCTSICPKTQDLRRRYLLPTLVQSKGTFHVALLHLERDWRIPNDAHHRRFQEYHQTCAIVEVRKALKHPDSIVPIEMFVIVAKLATAASYQGDHRAIEAHYNGMAQLFIRHWGALASHPLFVLGLFMFWSGISPHTPCCADKAMKEESNTSYPYLGNAVNPKLGYPSATAFQRLWVFGFISRPTLEVIPDTLRLSHLIEQASTGSLTPDSARDLLRLMWHCPARISLLEASAPAANTTQLERALWPTLQLVLTLCVNPSMNIVAEHFSPVMKQRISSLDLSAVLEAYPEVLLWMLLVAGSCSTPETIRFFAMMLRLLADSLSLTRFENASLYAKQFVWSTRLDGPASQFWNQALTGIDQGIP